MTATAAAARPSTGRQTRPRRDGLGPDHPDRRAASGSTRRSTSRAKRVAECHSTSSIFRGYSIFMKGKDPRDAHFITSRICGICGDNHATCSVYNQNMAYGVRPPHLGEWIINLGEAAEYMFDHNIFQENLVGVDYCEKMVAETNPGVLEQANRTESPHAADHGYKTIGDIMRALNPFTGEFYREALQVSRYTREMFCLMEGRHVHPSTLYPGGVGTRRDDPAVHRLLHPAHALRGVHEAGRADARRPVRLHVRGAARLRGGRPPPRAAGLLGLAQRPRPLRLPLPAHDRLGPQDVRHPRRRRRRQAGHQRPRRDQPGHPDPARAARSTGTGRTRRRSSTHDPLGNPVDRRHPWNQHTIPAPQKRDFDDKYSWTMSPRWFDGKDHLAAGHRRRPARPAVGDGAGRAGGHAGSSRPPGTACRSTCRAPCSSPRSASSGSRRSTSRAGRCPTRSSATGRGPTSRPTRPPPRCTSSRRRWPRCAAGHTQDVGEVHRPGRGDQRRVHRGGPRRAVAPHGHPRREDRELPPVPADAVERQRPRQLRHARPVRGRGAEHADLRGEPRRTSSRASTSCGRCAASTRACPAACTCTSATASRCTRCTRPSTLNVI